MSFPVSVPVTQTAQEFNSFLNNKALYNSNIMNVLYINTAIVAFQ